MASVAKKVLLLEVLPAVFLIRLRRRQRDKVTREGLAKQKRGPKAKPEDPRVKELARENARLKRRLQRAEAMLEIQKKASELLGIPLSHLDEDDSGCPDHHKSF